MKTRAFILTTGYRTENDHTVVQLFGRSKKGNPVLIEDHTFQPFCYVSDILPSKVREFSRLDYVKGITREMLKNRQGKSVNMWKITVKYPYNVPEIRDIVSHIHGAKVWRADIVFPLNYMYIRQLGPRIEVVGDYKDGVLTARNITPLNDDFTPQWNVMAFDIENYIDETKHPDRNIICISTYTEDEQKVFYVPNGVSVPRTEKYVQCRDETDMIGKFMGYVNTKDPDIICGYNSDGYDWPHLIKRSHALGLKISLGRNGRQVVIRESRNKEGEVRLSARIPGRVSWDVWKSVRKMMKLSDETLDAVAGHLGIGSKMEVDSTHIDEFWERNPRKVLDYCIQDSKLCYDILKDQKFIENSMALADGSLLPLDDVKESTSSRMVDSGNIREYDKRGYAIPLNRFDDDNNEKIEGAFVLQPEPGIYTNVGCLDFRSLYPSIMMRYNICWTTVADNDPHVSDDDCYVIEWDSEVEGKDGTVIDVVHNKHRFYKPHIKKGVLPEIIRKLMAQRQEIKSLMRKSRGRVREYYDRLQNAIKIVMNSYYGMSTSSFYRFTDKVVGESITAFARKNIKDIIEAIESKKFRVVFSDTDSVGVYFHEDDPKQVVSMMEEISSELSDEILVLEAEKLYSRWFSHGRKKYYAGRIIWDDKDGFGVEYDDIKGYNIKRRDGCELQRKFLKDTLNVILNDEDINEHFSHVAEELKDENFHPDIKDLILTTSIRDPKHYKNPQQEWRVKLWDQLKDMNQPVFDGMRVSYIVCSTKPNTEYAVVIDGKTDKTPDLKYYKSRIIDTLAGHANKPSIGAVFGWDRKSFRHGMRKVELENFI